MQQRHYQGWRLCTATFSHLSQLSPTAAFICLPQLPPSATFSRPPRAGLLRWPCRSRPSVVQTRNQMPREAVSGSGGAGYEALVKGKTRGETQDGMGRNEVTKKLPICPFLKSRWQICFFSSQDAMHAPSTKQSYLQGKCTSSLALAPLRHCEAPAC